MASNRMHRGLVALSASAIAAVYMAGYLRTQAADATIAAAEPALTASSTAQVAAAPPPLVTVIPAAQPAIGRQAPPAPSTATPQTAIAPSGQSQAAPQTAAAPSGQSQAAPQTAAAPSGQSQAAPQTAAAPSGQSQAAPQTAAAPSGQTPVRTPTQTPGQAVQAGFKDGTYTGQGTSRRGDVWVQVQVAGGRISDVSITRSTLQYPLRDIAGLPQQVVDRQTAQVDIVSRATYSSMAFRQAVTQALSGAKAA